ncbi:MAG: helix-turn-helix transcriptional regulator [Firmicutes bacterium]|nr:helix-turn-helix transcriptional regulator [Bacillota bacterium]
MIADKIKDLREKQGLTQSSLARQLGITRSSVNAWELGISVPSTQYLVELAYLFSVSTDYLLDLNNTATVSVAGLSEKDVQLICEIIQHLRNKNTSD